MRLLTQAIILILYVAIIYAQTGLINLNSILGHDEARGLWPYSANRGILFYSDIGVLLAKDKIIYYDRQKEEIITSVKILKHKRYSAIPKSISINKDSYVCLYLNPAIGRYRIGVFDNKSNKLLVKKGHHQTGGSGVRVSSPQGENSSYAYGPHMTSYETYLDLYDENTLTPSPYSIDKFRDLFNNTHAYALWKYDEDLNPVDSADLIERSGDNLQSFLMLYENQTADMDEDGMIYLIHSAKNYLIRTYDSNLQLINGFVGENSNFLPLPETLTKEDGDGFRATPGKYSIFYALFSAGDYLVSSFYQNPGGWERPRGPYYYDIYTKSGRKVGSGSLPYPFFGRDDSHKMYIYVKVVSDSWFGDDNYYLVEINIKELLAGEIDEQFMLSRIDNSSDK